MSAPPSPDPWLDELLDSERDAPAPSAATQARVWARLQASIAAAPATGTEAFGTRRRPAPPSPQLPPGIGLWSAGPLVIGALMMGTVAQLAGGEVPAAAEQAEELVVSSASAASAPAASGGRRGIESAHGHIARRPHEHRARPVAPEAPATGSLAREDGPTASAGEAAALPRRARPAVADTQQPDADRRRPERPHRAKAAPRRRRAKRAQAPPVDKAPPVSTLRQELALVRQARAALGRKEPAAALRVLAVHGARFPQGELTEERAALRVVALASAGRLAEAQRAGRDFRRRYPESLQTGVVRAALAGAH